MNIRLLRDVAALVWLIGGFVPFAFAEGPQTGPPGRDQSADGGEYRIGVEDVLYISVWKNEVLSRAVSVRPDGKISLPLLNDVQAAGATPLQLRNLLAKRLREYMPDPEVSVTVQEVRSLKVSVIGEVKTPGRYYLKSSTTVLEVLAQAGGLSEFASRSRLVILRPDGETMQRIPFNYKIATSMDGGQENFYLQPGDIVLVP